MKYAFFLGIMVTMLQHVNCNAKKKVSKKEIKVAIN